MSAVRLAILWRALDGFLEQENWTRCGDLGWHEGGSPVPPSDRCLLGTGEPPLEFPVNRVVFLERGEDRMIASFAAHPMGRPGDGNVEVQLQGTEEPRRFLQDWIESARARSVREPLKLHPGPGSWTRTEGRADEPLLEGEVRAKLDFAVSRFLRRGQLGLDRLGVRARGGVILAGPPGTGKSSCLRFIERTAPCSCLWASPADLDSVEGVREIFEIARLITPTILFLEDLDVVAESRNLRYPSRGPLGELLTQLDGEPGDHPLLTIATTNRLDVVEEALRNRPGRFDTVLELGPFGSDLRRRFLEQRFRGCQVEKGLLEQAVESLDGATGAEIEAFTDHTLTVAAMDRDAPDGELPIARRHVEAALGAVRRSFVTREVGFAQLEEAM